MSDKTERNAVREEFFVRHHHGFRALAAVRAAVKDAMADEIVRLRAENAALRAEIDRLRARENVIAQHEDTGRTWNGPRCAIPSRYFEVNSAEQEVGRE